MTAARIQGATPVTRELPLVASAISTLKARGFRVTPARRALLEALTSAGSHSTAEELAARVRAGNPEVSNATVYRTLDTLEELGLAFHVHLGHGPATWHLADDAHHHFACQACGAVIEIPPESVAEVQTVLLHAIGCQIDGRHFALTGLCKRCSAGES